MRKVVSNTGPLLHLQEAQLLSLLEQVGQLYIPKAVDLEMVQYDQDWRDHQPGWIVAATVSAPHSSSPPIKPLISLRHGCLFYAVGCRVCCVSADARISFQSQSWGMVCTSAHKAT
jgi:hypothetical protein